MRLDTIVPKTSYACSKAVCPANPTALGNAAVPTVAGVNVTKNVPRDKYATPIVSSAKRIVLRTINVARPARIVQARATTWLVLKWPAATNAAVTTLQTVKPATATRTLNHATDALPIALANAMVLTMGAEACATRTASQESIAMLISMEASA